MRKKQSGSAHIIMIVVLVVALIGVLGFALYQNLISKQPAASNTAETTNMSTPANSTTQTDTTKYLTLSDWDVKFTLPEVDPGFVYVKANELDKYSFSTKAVNSVSGCEQSADSTPVANISRSKTKSTAQASPPLPLNNEQPINGYYYYYSLSQYACSEQAPVGPAQEEIITLFKTIQQ